MQALEQAGCLTDQEFRVLDDAYRFLRKTEHRLQLLFDLQTHRLPDGPDELSKLARRMGYVHRKKPRTRRRPRSPVPLDDAPPEKMPDVRDLIVEPLDAFLHDYHEKTEPTRRILDHLLHQTFSGASGEAEPESDLILDPNPDPETVRTALEKYRLRDVQGAYQNLALLAQESVPFLSTRRCRHFLASIAPGLLRAVADTPDPDMALVNLEKVTASLGAKTVLWELFSFNPPSLKLYVDLCAGSQFLSEILINNPGMIDELLDTLVLNQPRTADELRTELTDLCRGATDPDPILHSFQDKELLRIGVRDILGKATIRETTAALSDLAETILTQITSLQGAALEKRLGVPTLAEGERAGQRCRYAILGLGKLGGREMNYHSDLDLVLIYEGDGRTVSPEGWPRFDPFGPCDNLLFFTDLAQRIIRSMSVLGPMGRLYQVDMRLRPTGRSGSLVLPARRIPPLFRSPGRGCPALGATGADAGARGPRRRGLRPGGNGRGRGRGVRLALASRVGRRGALNAATSGGQPRRARPEARLRRRRGRGLPRAALSIEIRPRPGRVADAEHLGRAGRPEDRGTSRRRGPCCAAGWLRFPAARAEPAAHCSQPFAGCSAR